jgi:Na+-translocating ferredoxin:NAD+ oxidoreductase subunit D
VRRFLLDGSALLTGLLLALSLPPWAPWWIGVVGAILAILLAKQIFGGLGQNLFNPAMAARVALLISFPMEMTTFLAAAPPASWLAGASGGAGHHLRRRLRHRSGEQRHRAGPPAPSWAAAWGWSRRWPGISTGRRWRWATPPAAWGRSPRCCCCSAGCSCCGSASSPGTSRWPCWVPWWRWRPVSTALSPGRYPGPLFHLLSGATLLGAFFIATDPVTSPVSPRGQLIFGAGCGLLVFIIRTWAGYPEGWPSRCC